MADGSIRIETKLDNSTLKQQVKELEKELKAVQKEQEKVNEQAGKVKSKYDAEREFDAQFPEELSHREDIDAKASKELDSIIAKQEELNQKEQAYLEKLEAVKAKLAEQADIASASKKVDDEVKANSIVAKVQTQEQYNSLLEATQAKMTAIESAAAKVAEQMGISKDKILAANPEYKKLSDIMSILKSKAGEFGDKAKTAGDKATKGLRNAKKEANGFGAAITKGIKKIGRLALAVFGIRGAYGAVRTAVSEYLATNEQLAGQLATLKAGFGEILGPAIKWVINLLFDAVNAVNSFVFALTGINFAAKANEAALKKQAKATKDAAKATQLAGFDEQTKLSDTSSASSVDSTTLLDDSIKVLSGFAERLKEQILSGDWYGAGKTAGKALMDGINSIDWSGIGTTIGEIVGGAFAFALGFVVSIDPVALLESLVDFAVGLMESLSKAIQGLDWVKIGEDILVLLIKGLTVSLITTNPFAMLIALIFTPQGNEITEKAAELVGSITGALLAAIVGAYEKLFEIGKAVFNGIKEWLDKYVDWGGTPGEIINGLLNGVKDVLKSIGSWIQNHVWPPFRDGFLKAFGTGNASKLKEFGADMMEGLRNGITGAISKVKNACQQIWSAIQGVFSSVGSWFKTTFTNAWTAVKNVFSAGGKIFDGIKDGIASTFKTIVNGLITGINKVIAAPFNSINGMLNTIRGITILGVSPFKNLWSYNPLSIPQIPKLALGGIVNRPGRGVPAIIGEAGAEAVLPLENNTEWMDMLAEKIGGNVTIPIYMDGKKIATYVVDIQKKKAFAMNGA